MTLVSSDVRASIDDFLSQLEDEYDVTVVLAVAHGSHAWGLNSPNSDYDVQIVYAPNSVRHFAYLGGRTATLEREYQGDHDIEVSGWDVTKFAELLLDSNDQAIDALRSPVAYRETFDRTSLHDYMRESFSPIALYHAYRGIAKNNYRKYLSHHLVDNHKNGYPIIETNDDGDFLVRDREADETFWVEADHPEYSETQTRHTVKRNLAVLKAAMSANYLRHTGVQGEHQLPNVDFPTFVTEQAPAVFDSDIIDTAERLIAEKQAGNGDKTVGDLIGREFAHPEKEIDPSIHATRKPDQDRLNEFIDTMLDSV